METKHVKDFPLVRFVLAVAFLVALLAPLPMYGAGVLKGRVTDKADGEGVAGASVVIVGTTLGAATDLEGNYTLGNVPEKQLKVSVSIVGYAPASQTVTISPGQTATANFSLGQTTIMASEVVVGAALYKQDRLDVPVTTNVVSQEKIKEEPNPSLDQVIEDVPGVNINRSAGYATSTVQIRGSNVFQGGAIGTRVQGLYDGFPMNTPESGEVVWTNVNMNAADKVEVLKGAAATLYGSGAMGGVVNVFGHLPDKFEVKAGANVGFYDKNPDSDVSHYRADYTPWFWGGYVGLGNKSGKLNYSLLYSHNEDDGYKENSSTQLNDIKLKAKYDIDARQYLQLSAFYNETEGGYTTIWPYNLTISGFSPVTGPSFRFTPFTNRAYDAPDSVYADDTIKRKNALVGLSYVNLLSDKLSMDARLYYTHNETRVDYNPTNQTQRFGFNFFIPGMGSVFYPLYQREPGEFNEHKSDRLGAGVKFDWRVNDCNRLLFGVDGNIVDLESTQYTADIPEYNTLKDIQEKNAAVFLQNEWKISDRLTALLSARYDWSGIDSDNVTYVDYANRVMTGIGRTGPVYGYRTVTVPIENSSVDAISPRIALNYKATDDMSFRASWGKSFRAPTLAERFVRDAGIIGDGNPNPDIDKETMTAYEVGVFKQFSDQVSLDVAAYINDYDDLIESRTIGQNGAVSIFEYQNVAKARIWGIETSLNIRPSEQFNLNLGYAYMNAQDKSDSPAALAANNPDPDWLAYRPEHTASASATWKPTSKLALNLTGRYVSKYKAITSFYAANTSGDNYPGDFIVLNTGVKFQATENIGLNFLCKNITNKQYEEAEWFRAPGRSFMVGLDLTY
jgi:iron complex outermembrane receptor protein